MTFMTNAAKASFALIAAAMLSGCAGTFKTNQVAEAAAKPVPADRVLVPQEKRDGDATVTIIRDSGYLFSGCFIAVGTSKTIVARLDPSEVVRFYVPAGSQKLTVYPDPSGRGLCASGFEPVTETYKLDANTPNVFRLSARQYRRPELEPME